MRRRRPLAPPLTPHDELCLLLCSTHRVRSAKAGRIAQLVGQVDDDLLFRTMATQRILPIATRRLDEAGLLRPGLERRTRGVVQGNRMRSFAQATACEAVLRALAAQGVDALPLKGTVLSDNIYGDPGCRVPTDIDILVQADDLGRGAAALAGLGYGAPEGVSRHGDLPELHHSFHHNGGLTPVELHWRIHWLERNFSAKMLERSRAVDGPLRRAQPADELAALLLFYARDGFAGLRLAADIAAWWDVMGHELAPGALDGIVEAHPRLRRAFLAASSAADGLIGAPLRSLLSEPDASERASVAARLANWNLTGAIDQIMSNVTLVDLLVTPPGGLGDFAARHLFLPTDKLDDYYGLSPEARFHRLMWRALHPPKVIARYVGSMVMLQLRGTWSARLDPVPRAS